MGLVYIYIYIYIYDSKCVTCLGTVVDNLSGGIDCGMSGLTKVDFKEIF